MSWLWKDEMEALLSGLPDVGRFCEIGTGHGVTAARVADSRPELFVLCVDLYQHLMLNREDGHGYPASDGLRYWMQNRWTPGRWARPNMHLFVGTMVELVELGVQFDAILVDGNHEEHYVLLDLESSSKLLKPGGTIFVHDYEFADWPGVKAATDRFCEAGWNLEHLARTLVRLVKA